MFCSMNDLVVRSTPGPNYFGLKKFYFTVWSYKVIGPGKEDVSPLQEEVLVRLNSFIYDMCLISVLIFYFPGKFQH